MAQDQGQDRLVDRSSSLGLQCCTSVDNSGHNNITDISPLAKLTDLHELHLSSNKISDISVLSGLHNLTDLEVGYNSITDLTPLSGLHLLSKLTISGNAAL
ncbi:leucine-rich repeat domain-containing protein [Schleiferilactobacillus harbinensis]|nr:leucine-rich repeat domain-containing protein [Schleiferilactobacillus harbinensis]